MTYNSYSDWELTTWRCDPDIKSVYPFGDTIIVVEDESLYSIDKGITWKPLFEESEPVEFYSIIKLNDYIFLNTFYNGILFTSDLGKTWHPRNNGMRAGFLPKLYTDGKNLFRTLSGGKNGGLYISTDLGENWSFKINGLPIPEELFIETIAFNKGNIYIGTFTGVYVSSDLGENWTSKSVGLPEYPFPSYFLFNDKDEIFLILKDDVEGYNKFYKSNDGGDSWVEISNNIDNGRYLITYNAFNDTILIGADEKIYMTVDFGETWKKLTDIKHEENWQLHSISISGSEIYVNLSGELFKSTDLGVTWLAVKPKSYRYGEVNSMVMINNKLVVSTNRNRINFNPTGIYISTDLGESWVYTRPSVIFDRVESVKKTTFAVHKDIIFAGTNIGIFKSTDIGESWIELYEERKLDANNFSFGGDTIFATADMKYGVFMSPDLGQTWQALGTTGLPVNRILNNTIVGNQLFVQMYDKAVIFKTTDLGENWIAINTEFSKGDYLSNLYSFNDNLYITSIKSYDVTDKGIYFSSDFGVTWELRNNGLPDEFEVLSFYDIDNTLFAVIWEIDEYTGMVYTTSDQGLNWIKHSSFNKHLFFRNFAHNEDYIFASKIFGNSSSISPAIYRAKLSDFGITDVKEKDNTQAQQLTIYPLPSSDFINISNIGYDEKVEIFDVLGNKVMVTKYNGKINISSLPIGVYFIHTGSQRTMFIKGN